WMDPLTIEGVRIVQTTAVALVANNSAVNITDLDIDAVANMGVIVSAPAGQQVSMSDVTIDGAGGGGVDVTTSGGLVELSDVDVTGTGGLGISINASADSEVELTGSTSNFNLGHGVRAIVDDSK